MKKNNRLLFFSMALLIVTAGLIIFIVYNAPDPQSDVIVSYEKPASFDPVKSTQFKPTPVETVSPVHSTSSTPTPTISAPSIPDGRWTLSIRDPLGDPIQSGIIAFGSDSLSFTGGRLIIPATASRELTVRASAEGYAPGEFTVTPDSPEIVLDYLCDFSIRVEDEKGNPAPNTTIRVWKSNPPPRPVLDETTVYLQNSVNIFSPPKNSFRLMRTEYDCKVSWVSEPAYRYDAMGSPRGEVYPQIGDVVTALGTCPWRDGYNPLYVRQERFAPLGGILPLARLLSCRLRIWDSLCLSERTDSRQIFSRGFPQVLEILREGQIKYYYQIFPKCPENQPPLDEGKTDERGEWKLRGVPPALYYVQAVGRENRCSEVVTLSPACGGARLRLWGVGNLWVYVEREGVSANDYFFARVPDAEISLQSEKGFQSYAEKTNDEGEARIENLPYGKYRLTAKALGQTVEKTITVKKYVDTCTVKLPQDEFYTVSGIVLEEGSGDPVAGYPLELNSDCRSGSCGYRIYEETTTDEKGRFEFQGVIPGDYCLSEDIQSLEKLNFIFSDSNANYGELFESYTHLNNINLYVYEDLREVKVVVKPVVKTTFSGIVVDQNGAPAANAEFSVAMLLDGKYFCQGKMKVCPKDFKTGADGLFSLTIFSDGRSTEDFFEFSISAMIGKKAPPHFEQKQLDDPSLFVFVTDQFLASSIGVLVVAGDTGDSFTDLRIVLEPQTTDKTLLGKFIAEGEERFSPIGVSAVQKNLDINVQKNDDGYFKAENLSAGEMTLTINPCIQATVVTPNGPYKYYKYLNRTVKVQIEDEHPQTYVEIPLQPSGYYWGYVKDGDGNPLPEIDVWAEDKPNPNGHPVYPTNQNGFFFISLLDLVEGKSYNIKYSVGGQDKVLPGVLPNTGNLLLQ